MRILLVDDEPDLREQLGSLLTRQKYIVDTAADGEAALDRIFEQPCYLKNNGIFISVYNTGPGIAEDDFENVFKQFYRVEKSRSLQYGGTGLGLAIVRKIVQLHGGTVKMESEERAWARITICLPVSERITV